MLSYNVVFSSGCPLPVSNIPSLCAFQLQAPGWARRETPLFFCTWLLFSLPNPKILADPSVKQRSGKTEAHVPSQQLRHCILHSSDALTRMAQSTCCWGPEPIPPASSHLAQAVFYHIYYFTASSRACYAPDACVPRAPGESAKGRCMALAQGLSRRMYMYVLR